MGNSHYFANFLGRTQVKTHLGAQIVPVARTAPQIKKVVKNNPFQQNHDIARVFFVSFKTQPTEEKVKEFFDKDFSTEKSIFQKKRPICIYPEPTGKASSTIIF